VLLRDNALTESIQIEELSRGSEPSLFEFPSCKVRKVAVELVQIADKTLKDALHQTPLGSESMYQCVRAIFDLYRAIVPVQISSKEDEVPMLALLVHNDCMYLSHQLLTLSQRYKFALPSSRKQGGDMTFLDLIVEYRKMAEKYFFQYMQAKVRNFFLKIPTRCDSILMFYVSLF
jgi:protein transport protein DSL1/ZW10